MAGEGRRGSRAGRKHSRPGPANGAGVLERCRLDAESLYQQALAAVVPGPQADRQVAERAILGAYRAADLPEPMVVWVPSPLMGSLLALTHFVARWNGSPSRTLAALEATRVLGSVGRITRNGVDSHFGKIAEAAGHPGDYPAAVGPGAMTFVSIERALIEAGDAVDTRIGRHRSGRCQRGSLHEDGAPFSAFEIVGPYLEQAGLKISGSLARGLHRRLEDFLRAGLWRWGPFRSLPGAIALARCGVVPTDPVLEAIFAACLTVGRWLPLDGLALACERPTALHTEPHSRIPGSGRLHGEDGPAIQFSDGWSIYALHGETVAPHVIREPESVPAREALADPRSAACKFLVERRGLGAMLGEAGAEVTATDVSSAGKSVRLWRILDPESREGGYQLLEVGCSPADEGRLWRVPAIFRTCEAAEAWATGLGSAADETHTESWSRLAWISTEEKSPKLPGGSRG